MINWGIIGCGSVTEVKSGPAFSQVAGSSLVAVMSREIRRARNYASRHGVDAFYDNGLELINDHTVNAIYIATPPSSHEEWCNAAIKAGKPVYVEKPMALNYAQAMRMADLASARNVKLSVAHYRRAQPLFLSLKKLMEDDAIGRVKTVQAILHRPLLSKEEICRPATRWRIDPAVSGGGLFHDLAPHQLDLMTWFFGDIVSMAGISSNNNNNYKADDYVEGKIQFKNGVEFNGVWNFNKPGEPRDECLITGSKGFIKFSFFKGDSIMLKTVKGEEVIHFEVPVHAQLPMIEKVVAYFNNKAENPCSGYEGAKMMQVIEAFTS